MSRIFLVAGLVLGGCVPPVASGPVDPKTDGGAATTVDGGTATAVDGGAPVTGDGGAPPESEPDASVSIDFARDAGAVPHLFRLGVQNNGAADEVNRALTTEQKLGHVRLDLGFAVFSPSTNSTCPPR